MSGDHRSQEAHPFECDVSQGHLCAIEVEEVHELNGTTFLVRSVVNSTRLVVQLDIDREDFCLLCGAYETYEMLAFGEYVRK